MSRIAVVGGHGQIAMHLHPLLVESGNTPVALIRKPEQVGDVEAVGAEARMLDIENTDAEGFAKQFEGCDAVVFAAGGGPDGDVERKKSVDLGGSLKSIEGAKIAGITRFVQISAISVDEDPGDDAGEVWQAYVHAKRDADTALRDSGLDWTVIRPGGLTDDAPTGKVTAAEKVERGEIPRADVADVVRRCLQDSTTVGKQFELVGGDTGIPEALSAL
ncbi:SDR family oxidoreductase [Nocardioidaceae bacterium]|nr:SDR family oxidoreductase [Nocardioidaceae bacterium]